MKDRLEVLLYAETLQETLSPNANPRQGPVGGYQYWMPKAAARIQRAAQTLLHLSSTRFVIPKRTGLRKGGTKKVTGGGCAAGGWATLTSIKTIGGAPLLAFENRAPDRRSRRLLTPPNIGFSSSAHPLHTCHYDFHDPSLVHEVGAETAQGG
jgi:hypothetical protein